MNKAQMSIRMPYSLLDELNGYTKKNGLSKTEVVVRAIANYLSSEGDVSLHQRMNKVEKQMRELEILIKTNKTNS